MKQLRKIHKVSENLTLFGNVANAIDDNFEHVQEKIENTEAKIPQNISVIPGIEDYATRTYVQNVVTQTNTGGVVSLDGYASKTYVDNATLALSTLIQDNTNSILELKSLDKKFSSSLSDDTHVVFPVGNIGTDKTVGQLKEMTLSEIIQEMLFKETWPDSQSDYDFYCDIKLGTGPVHYASKFWEIEGIQIGPVEKKSNAVLKQNFVTYKTNATIVETHTSTTSETNASWSNITYTINCKYDPKTVTSTSNFGNTREYKWTSIKEETYTRTVSVVYPIFISNNTEILTDKNIVLERTLSSPVFIAVPWRGQTEPTVGIQLNTLGWLDANLETWEKTIDENYNGTSHKYAIWKYTGVIDSTPFKFDIKWQ